MTKDDLDKLRKYISITLSHSHPEHLDIYLHDMLDFCKLNLMEEENRKKRKSKESNEGN